MFACKMRRHKTKTKFSNLCVALFILHYLIILFSCAHNMPLLQINGSTLSIHSPVKSAPDQNYFLNVILKKKNNNNKEMKRCQTSAEGKSCEFVDLCNMFLIFQKHCIIHSNTLYISSSCCIFFLIALFIYESILHLP